MLTNQNSATLHTRCKNAFAITPGNAGNDRTTPSSFIGHNFISIKVLSIKMCFWVEDYMFFVLHKLL